MLWEVWHYLTTPTSLPYVRPMGFLKESIATAARARRCRRSWQPHYEACRGAILDSVFHTSKRRTALIFGAGTLEDTPLKSLSWHFDRVYLVDLVFLSPARRKAQRFPNVILVEHDVSESLAGFYSGKMQVADPVRWLDNPEVDLVVSLNMVTQLPLMPTHWLAHKTEIKGAEIKRIGQAMMGAHLRYLARFHEKGAQICLIADRRIRRLNRAGEEIKSSDAWWGVEPPPTERSWRWRMMPFGEASRHYEQVHDVGVSYWREQSD